MRRTSEIVYTLAFFVCGLWAIGSGTGTLFGGLEDSSMMGTWACAGMVATTFILKVFGDIGNSHTKTLVFIGLTALFGGIWGLGTILVILAGVLMLTRGFKQIKVVKGLTSLREIKQIRKQKLEEVREEEGVQVEESQPTKKPSVADELLEGFVGSDDYRQEIRTWIDKEEFEREEFTPDEIRARAKQELRENNLSLETLLALEALEKTSSQNESTEKDLTHVTLDLEHSEEDVPEEPVSLTEDLEEESNPSNKDMMSVSIEDLFNDEW